MKLSRYFRLLVAIAVLAGLAACSLPTTTAAGSGAGTTVNVTKTASALWMAAQEGSGAWQTLSGASFTVSGNQGKYGLAWVCPASGTTPASVRVLQSTVSESTSITTACPTTSTATVPTVYTVSGTVSGVPSGDFVILDLTGSSGNSYGIEFSGGSYSFSAAAGTYWLMAFEKDSNNNPGNMVLLSNIAVSGNVSNLNIDMSTGKPFTVGTASVAGAANYSRPFVTSEFTVPGEGSSGFIFGLNSPNLYPVVPAALMQSGDRYGFSANAYSTPVRQTVFVDTSNPGSAISLQLPAIVPVDVGFQVSAGTGTADWGSLSLGTHGAAMYLAAIEPLSGAAWYAFVTPGWLKQAWTNAATTYTFPDFTATSGWNNAWDFVTNQSATVALGGMHGNLSSAQLNKAYPGLSSNSLKPDSLPDGTTVSLSLRYLTGTY